jgi:hypothetical protein
LERNDINLFFVDWSKGSISIDYALARSRVNEVARAVGHFYIDLRKNFNIDSSQTTCIGFSLGAHACGLVYQHLTNEKFGKVIGLDPAGPLFDINNTATRINPDSATYVECIYTGYPLGIRAPLCQADFFINKGSQQPGCRNMFKLDSPVCSHYRALHYFSEALHNPKAFYGKGCESFEDVLGGSCEKEPGAFAYNDENAKRKLYGIFSVETNSEDPFGRGQS